MVRWYCSYGLSYRNLVEKMDERGLNLAHTTISKTIAGIEAMHTLWKGQMRISFSAGVSRAQIVKKLFGFTA